MIRILTAAALLLAPASALASDWRIASVDDGLGAIFLIDASSVVMNREPGPQARTLLIMAADEDGFAAVESVMAYDCAGNRNRSLSIKALDGTGKLVATEPADTEWYAVTPDSNFAFVGKIICDGGKGLGDKIPGELPIAAGRKYLSEEKAKR